MAFLKHYSDERLLASLDGELSTADDDALREHLKTCWDCRTRTAEIERQVQAVTSALAQQTFPGPGRQAMAKQRFLTWEAAFERTRPPSSGVWRSWLVPAACALVLVVVARMDWRRPEPSPGPAELLAQVQRREDDFARQPAHQVFRAEIREIAPRPQVRQKAILDVWTEPQGRRLAARWQDEGGALRRGLWHDVEGRAVSYASNRSSTLNPVAPFAVVELVRDGFDADRMEARFFEWIGSRDWRPVGFSSDLRTFADSRGARLEAERAAGIIRLTVQGESGGVRAVMIVEVDERTYRPRLQTVRFTSGAKVMELRLATEQAETRAKLRPTVFQPYSPPEPSVLPVVSRVAEIVEPVLPPPGPDLTELEIQVQYALHRVGACLGEQIDVGRHDNRVRVIGLVADEARRSGILAAVSELQTTSLTIDIRTFAEAIAPARKLAAAAAPVELHAAEFPLHDHLTRWFNRDLQRSARFSSDVIAAADAALAQAWALRHIRERYGRLSHPLSTQTRWLLESMTHDHEKAVAGSVREVQALLRPVLKEWISEGVPESSGDSFRAVQHGNRLIHGLFAGADLGGKPAPEAIRELWGTLAVSASGSE